MKEAKGAGKGGRVMSEQKHTPYCDGPSWSDGRGGVYHAIERVDRPENCQRLVAQCVSRAERAHIVRAANSHAALVEACRKSLDIIEAGVYSPVDAAPIKDILRAALALAEGE